MKMTTKTYEAIFEVKFSKKSEEAMADSRERTAASLSISPETVASVVEGSDYTGDNFGPTAECIRDRKERVCSSKTTMRCMSSSP